EADGGGGAGGVHVRGDARVPRPDQARRRQAFRGRLPLRGPRQGRRRPEGNPRRAGDLAGDRREAEDVSRQLREDLRVMILARRVFGCQPRESGGPGQVMAPSPWIPAFAGMTIKVWPNKSASS